MKGRFVIKNIELLSPAGSFLKLKYAIEYGADAVYIGGSEFSLRAAAENADENELKNAVSYAHSKGKKVYVTTNIVARNADIKNFDSFLKQVINSEADAVIVTDLGLFAHIREVAPSLEIHVSTQANSLNYESCNFFYKMGAKRIVLARELSLEEILEIRKNTPKELELEAFVHGAMCMAYSGRCLLSDYITDRSSNHGRCSQPCRFKYALVEEKRTEDYMPIYEDEGGTFILNSKDLCMIEHIDKLANAGIHSFKIEGRVKTEFYVSTVTGAYRRAIDDFQNGRVFNKNNLEEVLMASHRTYTTGFYLDETHRQIYGSASYEQDSILIGNFIEYDKNEKLMKIQMKNKFYKGDTLELIAPNKEPISFIADELYDVDKNEISMANHPMDYYYINAPLEENEFSLIRKRVSK
ncbi:MAG: U32 family peptidase [Clostridia bacterium]